MEVWREDVVVMESEVEGRLVSGKSIISLGRLVGGYVMECGHHLQDVVQREYALEVELTTNNE